MPLPGVMKAAYIAEPGSVEARSMTPALAQASVLVWAVTCAVTLPLPLSDCQT